MEDEIEYWRCRFEDRAFLCVVLLLVCLSLFVCLGQWYQVLPIAFLSNWLLALVRDLRELDELVTWKLEDLGWSREVIAPGVVLYVNEAASATRN